jgi:subtilisin-like proprotein convertase family protein
MTLTTRSQLLLAGAALCSLALPAKAGDRRTITSDMMGINQQMRELKASGADSALIARLQARFDALAGQLSQGAHRGIVNADQGPALAYGAVPAGTVATTNSFSNNTPLPIPDANPAGISKTFIVAGLNPDVWDVDVNVAITHTWCSDMDITVQSPAGTIVTLSTDNGGSNDNVYNGTKWDDQGTLITQIVTYTNNVAAPLLIPEGALGKFFSENPNGIWTVKIVDDLGGDVGTFGNTSIDITTLDLNLTETTSAASNNTPVPIPDANLGGATSNATMAGAGASICDVNVQAFITHTWNSDLLISVKSPAGTEVILSRWRAGSNDNVFNGTTWDDSASALTSDNVYANNVVATPLVPEGAMAQFQGQNPNGIWSLKVVDDVAGDVGNINSWTVTCKTCAAAECWLVLGNGAGNTNFTTYGITWQTQMNSVGSSYPVLTDNIPAFPLPARHAGNSANGLLKADRPMVVAAQVFMWNPAVFPGNPSQWSNRMDVYVAPNEQPVVTWHGSTNGIHINYSTFVGPDGKWYIQFPFAIDGM